MTELIVWNWGRSVSHLQSGDGPHLRVISAVVVATDSCNRCNRSETPDSM